MALLINYLGLCLLRNDPNELFPTKSFIWKTIVFYILSGIVVEGLIADFADGTLEVLLRTVMAFFSISIFLLIKKRWHLFSQVFTAIFVCENLIYTLAVIAEALDFYMVMSHIAIREIVSISFAATLLIWYLIIISYVIRRFLDYSKSFSLLVAFCYFVITYGIPMMFMDI